MKKNKTEFETNFRKEVIQFKESNGLTMSQIGNNNTVRYSNISKLEDFFVHGIGSLNSNVIGRIKTFIKESEESC